MFNKFRLLLIFVVLGVLAACSPASPSPTPLPLADEITFFDWPADIPQSVLDAFTSEYGVKINYTTFEAMEEAKANLEAGEVYDVVVLESDVVAMLGPAGLLAEINYDNIPNFAHIAPNFKDMGYDPDNRYSVPYRWGSIGLVVRSDLVEEMPTSWADLWDPKYAGKVAVRDQVPYDLIGATLKSLGYPLNTEDPAILAKVEQRLLDLRPNVIFVPSYAEAAVPLLESGEAEILVGWAEDVIAGQAVNEKIVYVMPTDGTMLWGDNFVIPANSPHKYTAELFVNFLLRPEISAQIINENYYAMPNEAAYPLIKPEILNNPAIYPEDRDLVHAEIFLPLSPAGDELYQQVWANFISQQPPGEGGNANNLP